MQGERGSESSIPYEGIAAGAVVTFIAFLTIALLFHILQPLTTP